MEPKNIAASVNFIRAWVKYACFMENEDGREDIDPELLRNDLLKIGKILGLFEGRRLKGWGLLSDEFEEFLSACCSGFGYQLIFEDGCMPPLEGKNLTLTRSGSNEHSLAKELAVGFISSLLSIYGLKEVTLNILSREAGSIRAQIAISPKSGYTGFDLSQIRDFKHKANNYLGGIVSFASLIAKKKDNTENVKMILESAQRIRSLINESFEFKQS